MRCRGLALLLGLGCGAEEESSVGATPCVPPHRVVAERCIAPGVQDDGCPAGTLGVADGSCQAAGVPPEQCGEGFEPDGSGGCEPVLPPTACPAGQLAVPGDAQCRAVMPCGDGKWGAIPREPGAEYVDAAYAGVDSDGTSSKPWRTIAEAVLAAQPGALVAIAEGNYLEEIAVAYKPVRIWGVCPERVALVGPAMAFAALYVSTGASDTEVHGVAITGDTAAFVVSGAENMLLDRVWIHDAAARAVNVQDTLGPTSLEVRDSLLEGNADMGVFAGGSEVRFDGVVVRNTRASGAPQGGIGMSIQYDPETRRRGRVIVDRTVIEQNRHTGLLVIGSDASVENSVVRGTLPGALDAAFGRGMSIQTDPLSGTRSTAVVRSSMVRDNREVGVFIGGSDATLEAIVVRGTLPEESSQRYGGGVVLQIDPTNGNRTDAVLRASLVTGNHAVGVLVAGSDALIETIAVRDTLPLAATPQHGVGIAILPYCTPVGCDGNQPGRADVRGSEITHNHTANVSVVGSHATLEALLVTHAAATTNLYGDGAVVMSLANAPADAAVTSSRLEHSTRAGLSTFGGAVSVVTSAFVCNGFDLASESNEGVQPALDDIGGNGCGCPDPAGPCHAQSAGLQPPAPPSQ